MSNCQFSQIGEVLRQHQRFVVMSHYKPDGDAIGCTAAMALCLRELGKDVAVWNQDPVPQKLRFLPGAELVQAPPAEPQEFEVAIVLDTAVQDRVGACLPAVKSAGTWINIDHHVSNPRFGDLAYIDSVAPATGQILFELFQDQQLPLTPAMADNLFVAISTDTGAFRYPNTTARTYEIGAELVKAGARIGDLSQRVYESHPRRRLELLRAMLNRVRFSSEDRVASFSLPLSVVAEVGSQPEDTEDLIDYIRSVDTVVAAAFLEEQPDGKVRMSLRSKDPRVDVCRVCQQFGGGGHILASGARTSGSLAEVEERVLQALGEEVAKLPSGQ